MEFSIVKEKISPENPVYQQGFSARKKIVNTGINDDIYVTVLLMNSKLSEVSGIKKELCTNLS